MKQILKLIRSNRLTQYFLQTSGSVKILVVFTILACGPMPMDFNEYFSLFYPEVASTPLDSQRFQFMFTDTYNFENKYNDNNQRIESHEEKVNIDAWQVYLSNKIDRKSLLNGLYETDKMGGLIAKVQTINADAATYLKLTKTTDDLTLSHADYWETETPKDSARISSALKTVREAIDNTSDNFLKERYVFQAIKLAASLNEYKQVLGLYENSKKQISQPSFISQWSRARAAGATMALGDTAEATLEFAQIFYAVPTRRAISERSLVSVPDKYFTAAHKLCKSDNQKANILAVAAIQRSKDGLEEIKQMYELDPQHAMLELIFAREINKNENTFFAEENALNYSNSEDYYTENYEQDPIKIEKAKAKASTYLEKLQNFAQIVAKDKKVKSVNFWNLSDAYFYFLKNDPKAANDILASLNTSENPFFEKQVSFLRFQMADKTFKTENEKFLLDLFGKFETVSSFRDNNMKISMAETLHDYYNQKSEKKSGMWGWLNSCSIKTPEVNPENRIKGFLALNAGANISGEYGYELTKSQDYYVDTCSVGFLNQVLSFIEKPNNSIENKTLIRYARLRTVYLNLALARRLVLEEKYDLASVAFKKIDAKYLVENGFEEHFESNPKDFNTDKNLLTSSDDDNPFEFLEILNTLKDKSASGKAIDLYNYGKARYNLSYYGEAWLLLKRHRSHYEIQYDQSSDLEKSDYYTTELAMKHFKKAAAANPDGELGAKICYGGALCERNQYWVSYYKNKPTDYSKEEAYIAETTTNLLPKYRSFFRELSTKYKNTQYNGLLLKECSTYADYIN